VAEAVAAAVAASGEGVGKDVPLVPKKTAGASGNGSNTERLRAAGIIK
jgi:hypothetical protein